MELLAASLVLVFALGATSWALFAHGGGLRVAGPDSPRPASARSFDATIGAQSQWAHGLYDHDEAEHDDVERDLRADDAISMRAQSDLPRSLDASSHR